MSAGQPVAAQNTNLRQISLLRAEYLHYGFGSTTYDFGGAPLNSKLSIDVVRGGLSYKF